MKDWAKALQAALNDEAEKVPKGWMTIEQWTKFSNKSAQTTWRRIVMMVKNGRAERRMFRINRNGVVRPIPHYSLTPHK
jgi:hypothetical protein